MRSSNDMVAVFLATNKNEFFSITMAKRFQFELCELTFKLRFCMQLELISHSAPLNDHWIDNLSSNRTLFEVVSKLGWKI